VNLPNSGVAQAQSISNAFLEIMIVELKLLCRWSNYNPLLPRTVSPKQVGETVVQSAVDLKAGTLFIRSFVEASEARWVTTKEKSVATCCRAHRDRYLTLTSIGQINSADEKTVVWSVSIEHRCIIPCAGKVDERLNVKQQSKRITYQVILLQNY
jgi:hypothetical protein